MFVCAECGRGNPGARRGRGDFVCECGRRETWGRPRDQRRRTFNTPVEVAFLDGTRWGKRAEADEAEALRICAACRFKATDEAGEFCAESGADLGRVALAGSPRMPARFVVGRCPLGCWGPPRVLFLLLPNNPPIAAEYTSAAGAALAEAGFEVCTLETAAAFGDLQTAIVDTAPDVVVFRSHAIDPQTLSRLAAQHPATRWVDWSHTSIGATRRERGELAAAVDLARTIPNVYLATVDERQPFADLGLERSFCLPNVVEAAEAAPIGREPVLRVHIAGRADPLKNIDSQIFAAAIAARRVALEVELIAHGAEVEPLVAFGAALGLKITPRAWSTRRAFLRNIDRAHVALCASYTESFCYVAAEYLVRGRPVVGSPAVRFLPAEWQADADDVQQLADVLVDVADNLVAAGATAARIGERLVAASRHSFVDAVAGLAAAARREALSRFVGVPRELRGGAG